MLYTVFIQVLADMEIFFPPRNTSTHHFSLTTTHFFGSIKCYKQAFYLAELLSTIRRGVSEVNRSYCDVHGALQSTTCSTTDKTVQLLGTCSQKVDLCS